MNFVWLLWFIAIVVTFALFEGYALTHNKKTLSRVIWDLTKGWPPLPFIFGLVVGGLAVHFFWIGQDCPGALQLLHALGLR